VSGLAADVSTGLRVVVSGAGITVEVSTVVPVVSVPVPSSLPLSLQATNAPIAKINNSFFIVLSFVCLMNDFMLIRRMKKGNLRYLTFFKAFFLSSTTLQSRSFGLLLLNFGINKGYQRENRK
jgi:hypothetical protein